MNNDLISRSKLKSVLENECFWCANRDEPCDKPCWHCINEKIDNAPTVEPEKVLVANVTFDEDKIKEIVQTEVIEKIKSGDLVIRSEEIPQGEWGKWIIAEIQCPNCFEYFETDCYSTEELNKCPNCGADMRKPNEKGGD